MQNSPILTSTDLAYLAGLFDGEGHAGVYRHKQTVKGRSYETLVGHITITMTDPEPVRFFALCFPGQYYSKMCSPSRLKYKPVYRWQCSSRQARGVAKMLLPYVKNLAKVKQLEKVLGNIPYVSR